MMFIAIFSLLNIAAYVEAVTCTYYIQISEPETHYAHIKIEVEDVGTFDEFSLDCHYWEEEYLYFENISVYGPDGQELEYTHTIISDSLIGEYIHVKIPNGCDSFTIEYDAHCISTIEGNLNKLHAGILADRAIFSIEMICFHNYSTDYVTLIFDIPSNWSVVSAWQGSGNTYQGTHRYIFSSMPSCGEYEITEVSLNDLTIRIGIPESIKDDMAVSSTTLVEMVKKGVAEMQKIYGNPSQSKVGWHDLVALIASYAPMDTTDSCCALAYFKSDGEDLASFQWWLAYGMGELLKFWLGTSEDTYWARQTMWRYELAINLRLFEYRSDSWVTQQVENWLSTYKEEIYGTEYDVPIPTVMDLLYYNNANQLSEEQRARFSATLQEKGSLFWFVIDEIIKEKTSRKKTIYDFMGHMNRNFAGFYSVEDVISALSSIANWDFTQFFDDYYYGIERLPVERYLLPSPEYPVSPNIKQMH